MKTNLNLLLVIFLLVAEVHTSAQTEPQPPASSTERTPFKSSERELRDFYFENPGHPKPGYKRFERATEWLGKHMDQHGDLGNFSKWNMDGYGEAKSMMVGGDNDWVTLGPTDSEVGVGRIHSIAFVDADTWLVGTAGGGLWKTDDAGIYLPGVIDEPWKCLTDQLPVLCVSGVTFNPDNPDEIYILTGDGDWSYGDRELARVTPVVPSLGIFKTTDGGQSWSLTGLDFTADEIVGGFKLVSNPANYLQQYACTTKGLYFTDDGWQNYGVVLSDERVTDLEFHPNDPDLIYFVTDDGFYTTDANIYGYNETDIDWGSGLDIPERIAIAVSPAQPDVVHLITERDNIFRAYWFSIDAGQSFVEAFSPGCTAGGNILYSDYENCEKGQGHYNFCIAANPVQSNVIYVGGVVLSKSITNGTSWGQAGDGDIHSDVHLVEYNPFTNYPVVGCDGGIWAYDGISDEWDSRNHGLVITQFYHIGTSNIYPGVVIQIAGGAQDNHTGVSSGVLPGPSQELTGGDGFNCHIGVYDEAQIYFSESQYGELFSSYYNDFTDVYVNTDITPSSEHEAGEEYASGNWDTPFEMQPGNGANVLAGYHTLYYSSDAGGSWEGIWSPESVNNVPTPHVSGGTYSSGSRIVEATWGSDANHAAHVILDKELNRYDVWMCDALLYGVVSNNDNNCGWRAWTTIDITGDNAMDDIPVSDVIFNPFLNDSSLIVTIPGYMDSTKVFLFDGNDTWTNISYDLPNVPVITATVDEFGIYVGTDIGIFFKYHEEQNWEYYSDGLPAVPVTDIEVQEELTGRHLYVGTYGRGIWRANAAVANRPTRWYVNDNATGTNTGLSWDNAFVSFLSASDAVLEGDSIFIAGGTYYPTVNNNNVAERNISFTVHTKNVKVFGGFAGFETSISERIAGTNETILSGDNGVLGATGENSYHVLNVYSNDQTLYDRITVANGNANGAAATLYDRGGGLIVQKSFGTPTKSNTFRDCTFRNNLAVNGGGVYIGDSEFNDLPVQFIGCSFQTNNATSGGGMYVKTGNTVATLRGDASIVMQNCSFTGNIAAQSGGALVNDAIIGGHSEYTIQNCVFTGNSCGAGNANGYGGAVCNSSGSNNVCGATSVAGFCSMTYENCQFFTNVADQGGAIGDLVGYGGCDKGSMAGTFVDCLFEDNSAQYYGGAVFCDASSSQATGTYTMTGCTFNNDHTGSQGGAIKLDGAAAGHAYLILKNTNFHSCTSGTGGAIYGEGFSSGYFSIVADSCLFDSCLATGGGAILLRSSTSGTGSIYGTITNCTFDSNFANGATNNSYAGAVDHTGSGIHVVTYDHCIFNNNHSNFRAGAVRITNNDVTFSNCDFTGNYAPGWGGAVMCFFNNNVAATNAFENCNFQSNHGTSGGAVYINPGSVTLHVPFTNCLFTGNYCSGDGGAIGAAGSGLLDLDITDCSFGVNYATTSGDGGAVSINANGSVDMDNSTFNANTTSDNSGAVNLLSVSSGTMTVNLTDCNFENNSAHSVGAILMQNNGFSSINATIQDCFFNNNHGTIGLGAIYVNTYDVCNVLIDQCTFLDNSSASSTSSTGAVYLRSNSTTDTSFIHVNDCIFQGNTAVGAAGALHIVSDGSLRSLVENCRFKDNTSGVYGGAIRTYTYVNDYNKFDIRNCLFENNIATSRGGAVFMETSTGNAETYGTIDQCVFKGNQGTEGGAVQAYMITTGSTSTLDVRNSTFFGNNASVKCGGLNGYRTNGTLTVESNNNIYWGNTDTDTEVNEKQLYKSGTMTLISRNNDVQDGLNASITDGGGNINADPVFVNSSGSFGPDVIWPSTDDGFSLQSGSPCINSANASYVFLPSDVAGTPRPQSGGYDIGAYEALAPAATPCPGDLNDDNVVNTSDLLLFMSMFGTTCSGCSADLNNDGAVNTSDLLLFMSAYGVICPE